MTVVTLHRTRSTPEGTFGLLYVNNRPVAITCEDPWNNNRRKASCIPAGRYLCVPHNGKRFSNTWEVTGVPGRSAILFHAGNNINQTEGCILPGLSIGEHEDLPAVKESQAAMIKLRATLPKQFWLSVIDGALE